MKKERNMTSIFLYVLAGVLFISDFACIISAISNSSKIKKSESVMASNSELMGIMLEDSSFNINGSTSANIRYNELTEEYLDAKNDLEKAKESKPSNGTLIAFSVATVACAALGYAIPYIKEKTSSKKLL